MRVEVNKGIGKFVHTPLGEAFEVKSRLYAGPDGGIRLYIDPQLPRGFLG